MQTNFELAEKDFVEAYATHCRENPSKKWNRAISYGCLVLVLGAFIFHAIATNASDISGYVPLVVLAIAWFVVIRFLQRSSIRKQFRNQPGAQGPRTVVFDGDGAHWRWDGGSSDVLWKNYTRWIEGDRQILLYSSPVHFSMLPKRALDPAQLVELRELLETNIVMAKK